MIKKTLISLIVSMTTIISCSNRLVNDPHSLLSMFSFDDSLYVVSITPANGAYDVPISMPINAVFSKEISFSTITGSSFVVSDNSYIPIAGTLSYYAASKTVTFTPLLLLQNLTEYNVLITTEITDPGGSRLANEAIWYFTTISNGTVPGPTFNPVPGTYEGTQTITIDCMEPNATIRYTLDGSIPTSSYGTIYTGLIPISVNTVNPIHAIAYRSGYTDSPITTASYTIQVMTPMINPPAGTYSADPTVTIMTLTTGATIKYTDDGSDPAISGTAMAYTVPFIVTGPGLKTIKAIAINPPNMADSIPLSADYIMNYTQVAPPVFTPSIGTYTSSLTVSLATSTPGATIKFTTDGSDPIISGIVGNTVAVNDSLVLKAYAYKAGMTVSSVTNSAGIWYIIAPKITAITPNKGPNTGTVAATIKGKNFKTGATAKLSLSGHTDIVASSLTVLDSSNITCTFDITGAYQTKWDVVVTNADGGSSINAKWFRIY